MTVGNTEHVPKLVGLSEEDARVQAAKVGLKVKRGDSRYDDSVPKDKVAEVQPQVGTEVKAIKCPNEVKVKAQASFTCTVTAPDGTTGIATATQTDAKGTIGVAAPFLPKGEAEQRIQTDLRTRSPRATVVCPDIIVVKPGGRFVCQANLGEINATITARQTNAAGSFTYTARTH